MWLKHEDISFPFVSGSDASVLTELGDFSPCCKSICQVDAASLSESRCPWETGQSPILWRKQLCPEMSLWLLNVNVASLNRGLVLKSASSQSTDTVACFPSEICEYETHINAHQHTSWMENNYHQVEDHSRCGNIDHHIPTFTGVDELLHCLYDWCNFGGKPEILSKQKPKVKHRGGTPSCVIASALSNVRTLKCFLPLLLSSLDFSHDSLKGTQRQHCSGRG